MLNMNKILKAAVVFGVASVLVFSCQTQNEMVSPGDIQEITNLTNGTPIDGQYIIVYNRGAMGSSRISPEYGARQEFMRQMSADMLAEHGIQKEAIQNVYGNVVEGFTAKLNAEMLTKVKSDPRVAYVEQDKVIALSPVALKKPGGKPGGGGGGGTPPAQETPWGILVLMVALMVPG